MRLTIRAIIFFLFVVFWFYLVNFIVFSSYEGESVSANTWLGIYNSIIRVRQIFLVSMAVGISVCLFLILGLKIVWRIVISLILLVSLPIAFFKISYPEVIEAINLNKPPNSIYSNYIYQKGSFPASSDTARAEFIADSPYELVIDFYTSENKINPSDLEMIRKKLKKELDSCNQVYCPLNEVYQNAFLSNHRFDIYAKITNKENSKTRIQFVSYGFR